MTEVTDNQEKKLSERPNGPRILNFNQGHSQELITAGLIKENSLYFSPNSRDPFASVDVDTFLQDERLKENEKIPSSKPLKDQEEKMPAQDALFEILYQEVGQQNIVNSLKVLSEAIDKPPYTNDPKKTSEYVERRLKDFDTRVRNEYWQAQATNEILENLEGPETEVRTLTRTNVNNILMRDQTGKILDADTKIKIAQDLATTIRNKLSH